MKAKNIKSILAFMLLMTLTFSFSNYNKFLRNQEKHTKNLITQKEYNRNPLRLLLFLIKIEYQSGHNDYIDGRYVECIRDGVCYIRINKKSSTWIDFDENIKINEAKIAINKENGTIYLVIPPSDANYKKYLKPFKIESQTNIDKGLIDIISQKLKKLGFKKPPKPLPIGSKVEPIKYGNYLLVPIAA